MSIIDQLLEDADKHPEKMKRLLQRIAIGNSHRRDVAISVTWGAVEGSCYKTWSQRTRREDGEGFWSVKPSYRCYA